MVMHPQEVAAGAGPIGPRTFGLVKAAYAVNETLELLPTRTHVFALARGEPVGRLSGFPFCPWGFQQQEERTCNPWSLNLWPSHASDPMQGSGSDAASNARNWEH
jgi:hypothetical protein